MINALFARVDEHAYRHFPKPPKEVADDDILQGLGVIM